MDGFSVATTRLEDAARVASTVAEGLRAADLGGPVRALAAAIPGGVTAAAGAALADGWDGAGGAAAEAVTVHGAALGTAAATYQACEAAACADLRW